MSKPARNVPYHLRQKASDAQAKVDAARRENLARLARPADAAPGPTVTFEGSTPVIQPRQSQPPPQSVAQPLNNGWPAPEAGVRLEGHDDGLNQVLNEQIDVPQDVPGQDPEDTPPDYEHLYRTFEGRASAEARARTAVERELAKANERLAELERKVSNEQLTRVDDATLSKYFTAEELTLRGVEACRNDIIRARRLAAEQTAQVQDEFRRTREDAVKQTGNQRRLALFQLLDNNPDISGWRKVDTDPLFLNWAAQPEPITGHTYAALLHEGAGNPDLEAAARACAEIYKRFIATQKKPAVQRQPTGRVLPNGRPPAAPPQPVAPDLMTPEKMHALTAEFKQSRDPKRRLEIQSTLRDAQARNLIVRSR